MKKVLPFYGKKTLIVILLILNFSLNSQTLPGIQITGNPTLLTSESISPTPEYRDKDGEVAAGLLIVSTLQGLNFESASGIIKIDKRESSEYLLYLSPSELFVNISCDGYAPLKLEFSGLGIKPESQRIWEIRISEDAARDTVISTEDELLGKSDIRGKLIITVTPAEASDGDVYINDRLEGKAPLSATLLQGSYKLKVRKEGYFDNFREIRIIKKEETKVNIEMIPLIVKRESNRTLNWVISGLAVLGSAASVYYYTETKNNYNNYQSNTICIECEELKKKTEESEKRYNISLTINAASLITSLMLWIFN